MPSFSQPLRQPLRQYTFRTARVIDVSETTASQGALIILYGNSGVGKTTTAAKIALLPEWRPCLIIDAEAGAKAVAHMKDIVKVAPMHSWPEISEAVDIIYNAPNQEELVYKLFIFDNLTQMEYLCIEHHKATDPRGPQRHAELQHYGRAKTDITEVVNKLRDAAEKKRIIIILNAWQKPELNATLNITKNEINLIPSLTASLPGMVDYVGWLKTGSFGVRELTFASSRESSAKIRRPPIGPASKIPLDFKFDVNQNPLGDVINTLIGGLPWPETNKQNAGVSSSNQ